MLSHAPEAQDLQRLRGLAGGLSFAENRGQWPDEVLFQARLGGAVASVTADGVTFDFYEVEPAGVEAHRSEAVRRGHVVKMRFVRGRSAHAVGRGRQRAYHNYLLGDDPSRWASRVPLYDEVVLEGLYDGIDLRLYEDEGRLRYDLDLAPGADASQILMRMEGAEGVTLTEAGALRMETALGPVEHRGLLAYQEGARGREVLASAFRVRTDGAVGFEVRGADPSRRLVIDPVLWATFLGGIDDDHVSAIAVAADASLTVAGDTWSADFPTTLGAYDTSFNGVTDVFVSRLSADGTALLYTTFLGGSTFDLGRAVAMGDDGSATVAGYTYSTNFPTTPGAYDTSYNGGLHDHDAFAVRLSADGTNLLYATYLGGTEKEAAYDVALNDDGSATLAGYTCSVDFPTTPGAYDTSYNGSCDAFATRLRADGGALLYSTFLGGTDSETAYAIASDSDGRATMAGETSSTDFPTTPGAYDTSYNGDSRDGFLAGLAADGSALRYATFLGGSSHDIVRNVAAGTDGGATVVGWTTSPDFPTTPGAYDTTFDWHPTFGFADAFVARFSANGSALLYGTFLGGMEGETAYGVAVGPDGSATVVGGTTSPAFPVTRDAFDTTHNGSSDAFVTRLSHDGSSLLYSTFLGGAGSDYGSAVTLVPTGAALVAGGTTSTGFPATAGSYDTSYNGNGDAFVARIDVGAPLPFALGTVVLNSPLPRGDTLDVFVTIANSSPDSLTFDLYLDAAGPAGYALTGLLATGITLVPGTTASATLAFPVEAEAPVGTYSGTVTAVETGGGSLGTSVVAFEVITGVAVEPEAEERFTIAVAPNPAQSQARIAFTLTEAADVRLAVYDVLGREVAVLVDGPAEAGAHAATLDASALPAGVYVYRLTAGGQAHSSRLTVVR